MNTIYINKPGQSTAILISAPVGAYYEENKYKGISHFLEHMCFKGSKNYSKKQISALIENVGGVLNAFTDWEITAYWAEVSNSYKDIAEKIIEDIVVSPTIPNKEVDKEREVIIQEIKMYNDNPSALASDIFLQALFDYDSGFHIPISGTKNSVSQISTTELKNWHEKYYNTKNLTKVVVGDVENSEYLDIPYYEECPNKKRSSSQDMLVTKKDLKQANIVIGNITNKMKSKDNIFLNILLDSLYNDMSGRLFRVVREKHHLVYRVHFYLNTYRNRDRIWEVKLGLEEKNIPKARKIIVKELIRPASKKEIKTIIDKSIGGIELALDRNTNIAEEVASAINRNLNYRHIIDDYKAKILEQAKNINEYIKELDFKNNILAGVIGEEINE